MTNQLKTVDLTKVPIFNVNPNELFNIAKNDYKYEFNKLSPFFGQPITENRVSSEMKEMSNDKQFRTAIKLLASPIASLKFCKAGAALPIENFSAYIGKVDTITGVVAVLEGAMALTLLFFKNIHEFASFLTAQNASLVTEEPINLIPNEISLETAISIFNLVDCIKRAYLNALLEMSEEPIKGILEEDYVTILNMGLKSGDVRWITPSFLRLVPGILESEIEFTQEHIDTLEGLKFLVKIDKIDKKDTRVLIPGTNGKYMGLEFTHFWKWSLGFNIQILESGKKETSKHGLYYMAATEEANHLFEICSTINSTNSKVIHTVHSYDGLANKLVNIFEDVVKKIN